MNVLVTGGAGFIGVNLCHKLIEAGYKVRVYDDESMGSREHLGDLDVEFVKGSLSDRELLTSSLQGTDSVVHLAADTRVMDSIENPQHNFNSNVIGTFNLLESMRAANVKSIVAASTGGAILGEVPCPVHEEIMPRPLAPYGASKLAMEGYLSAFSGAYGFKCASLRFSNVYGLYSFHKGSVVAAFFREILKGNGITVYGDGEQLRDYVFADDLSTGIMQAMNAGVSGVYQLGTGVPTSVNQLIEHMRAVVGDAYPINVEYLPARDGEIINTYCDVSKAATTFGYNPQTTVRDGLAQAWDWFCKHQ